MRTTDILIATVGTMVIAVAACAETNAPPVVPRTDAQVETELRAVLAAESKWLKLMLDEVEGIRAGLDRKDDAWKPRYVSGPPRYSYVGALTERREMLQEELRLLRSDKVQVKSRQQGAAPLPSAPQAGPAEGAR